MVIISECAHRLYRCYFTW